MSDFISTPSMILLICMAVIACHAVWVLMRIKKYEEEEKPSINNFSVYLKYKSAVRCFGICMVIWAAIIIVSYNSEGSLASNPFIAFVWLIATYYPALTSATQKLTIRDNQITHSGLLKSKTFPFDAIKKVESDYGFFTEGNLLLAVDLPDSQDYFNIELKHLDFEYNNIGMLVERLKEVGLIVFDDNLNESAMPENNRHLEGNRFVVKNKKYFATICAVFVGFFVLMGALMFFGEGARLTSGLIGMVLFLSLFLFSYMHYVGIRMIFDNNIFKCGVLFGKKFKIHDISHVKLWPHIDYFYGAHIFLKDGKCVYGFYKNSENFNLLIETLKRECVAFK